MVRINLIKPRYLADQHLIAEYNEILMLLGYVRKYPDTKEISEKYVLGTGHMKFFKDKLLYIKKRHEDIKKEMRRRGFRTSKQIVLDEFPLKFRNNYKPNKEAISLIKKRINEKLKMKPNYYRYYGENKSLSFFVELIKKA